MKYAVAAAAMAGAAMAAPASGEDLVRLDFFQSNPTCDFTLGDNKYDTADGKTAIAQANLNKFEFVKADGDADAYIVMWLYQYYTADGSYAATPADSFDEEVGNSITNTAFATALADSDPLGVSGRPLYQRVVYTGTALDSCKYEKNAAGFPEFTFDYTFESCSDGTCTASAADAVGDTFDVMVQDLGYSSTSSYVGITSKAPKKFFFWDVDADFEDSTPGCFGYVDGANQIANGSDGTWTATAPMSSTDDRMQNSGFKADGTTEATFSMDEVFEKMCGDSSRLASVAAFSVASVAASLLL